MSERRVRVLFAIPRFSVGGAEKLLVHQLRELDRARFDPTLVTIFDEKNDTFADGVSIDRCFHFRGTFDIRALWRLYRYIRRGHFDVVVTSLFSANLLARFAAIIARVPTVISYEHNIYPNKRLWQICADKLLSLGTDRIIADTESARIFTARQEHIPLEKFITLYIPPLTEQGTPRPAGEVRTELGIPERARVVLTVSRLVSDKGHVYLIEAAKRVLDEMPDVYFLIVGWGPLERELKEQAGHLSIAANIVMPGRMDIVDVLPLADVYVDPSVSTDLPIAIMEAMREGKAIVATRVGDVPVFVEHEVTGMSAQPADAAGLAEGITRFLRDASLGMRLGGKARERVARYSLHEYMRTFQELIERLADAKKAS